MMARNVSRIFRGGLVSRFCWISSISSFLFEGAAFVALLIAAPTLASAQAQVHLIPTPRESHFSGTTAALGKIEVEVPGHNVADEFAARDLEEAVRGLAPEGKAGGKYRIELLRADSSRGEKLLAQHSLAFSTSMKDEGYALIIGQREADVIGASGAGVFYGVQTLKQLLPLAGGPRVLPTGTVRDWPAMRYRGISDDLSRGPFPTLAFQKHQIQVFASFKLNVYSPYLENTLLYPGQPLFAPPGGALTPEDVKTLVDYARQYHITIVPEQESFGHLHHVLKYQIYQNVAETPYGAVLAPGQPGTIPLVKSLFAQVAKEFPSPFIHIGADETFGLGAGRTRKQVEQEGYGTVYVNFLKQIHSALAPLHRRLLFWGDIGDKYPAAVAGLPKDMIAVPWNYGMSSGFEKLIEPFAKAGMETWVAPGDSNWSEVYPIAQVALPNIRGFIAAGQRLGSTGALTTVWNDDGEGLFNMDWFNVLFGAAAAWQPGTSSVSNYENAFGRAFYHDAGGKVMDAERELIAAQGALDNAKLGMNSDAVFWLDPWSKHGQDVSAKLLPFAADLRTHAEQAIVLLDQARRAEPALQEQAALQAMDLGARRMDFIGMKFQFAKRIADDYASLQADEGAPAPATKANGLAFNNRLIARVDIGSLSGDLVDGYSALKAEYSQAWLHENRPYWLGNVTVRYDLAVQLWRQRDEKFQAAFAALNHGQALPAASTLGLPPSSGPSGTGD